MNWFDEMKFRYLLKKIILDLGNWAGSMMNFTKAVNDASDAFMAFSAACRKRGAK